MAAYKKSSGRPTVFTSWEPVADWYDGWVGREGSRHHGRLAVPAVLELLELRPGEKILDIGAGQGVLAPFISKAGAHYLGVEASERLLHLARKHHGREEKFIWGDARRLAALPQLHAAEFDAVVFLLSLQDMTPLEAVLESAAWALRSGGRMVLLLTHPCFHVPRQSGWGWDENRKLHYRRIDRYLTPLCVPMKPYLGQKQGTTRSFHRPLEEYINGLAACGLLLDRLLEIPTYKKIESAQPAAQARNLANQEIPLFMGLRAWKIEK